MNQWYVLYTKPQAEYQVAAVMQQRGIQTYLPEIDAVKAKNGRKKTPFFPCYLFINIDFEAVSISSLQWTPGLRSIVSCERRPIALSTEFITLIQCKLNETKAAGGWPVHPFKPGDTVRITDGPFRDMLAIFEGPTTPAQRVQVLLTILGHASRMQIDATDLKKMSPDVAAPLPKRPRRTRGQGRHINGVIPAWS